MSTNFGRILRCPGPPRQMWIAALTLQHNLVLCARDAHFDQLRQLARI